MWCFVLCECLGFCGWGDMVAGVAGVWGGILDVAKQCEMLAPCGAHFWLLPDGDEVWLFLLGYLVHFAASCPASLRNLEAPPVSSESALTVFAPNIVHCVCYEGELDVDMTNTSRISAI